MIENTWHFCSDQEGYKTINLKYSIYDKNYGWYTDLVNYVNTKFIKICTISPGQGSPINPFWNSVNPLHPLNMQNSHVNNHPMNPMNNQCVYPSVLYIKNETNGNVYNLNLQMYITVPKCYISNQYGFFEHFLATYKWYLFDPVTNKYVNAHCPSGSLLPADPIVSELTQELNQSIRNFYYKRGLVQTHNVFFYVT
jgi:hypothetical protein